MWELLFKNDTDVEVVGNAQTGKTALEKIKDCMPDIVLLDVELPDVSGEELMKQILEKKRTVKVLVISMYNDIITVKRMINEGASGYVSKSSSCQEMVKAIKIVYEGGEYLAQNLTELMVAGMFKGKENNLSKKINALTRRELQIISKIKLGLTSAEIAASLFISPRTVEVHRHNILKKLNVKNSLSLIESINKLNLLK